MSTQDETGLRKALDLWLTTGATDQDLFQHDPTYYGVVKRYRAALAANPAPAGLREAVEAFMKKCDIAHTYRDERHVVAMSAALAASPAPAGLRETLRAILSDFDREPTEDYLDQAERIFLAANPAPAGLDDLLMEAWGVIANAGGGDWTQETDTWQEAAAAWREQFHARLGSAAEEEGT